MSRLYSDMDYSLPPQEASLPFLEVEAWLQVHPGDVFLKGLAFDREGNLFVMAAYDDRVNRRILKITPQKRISEILMLPKIQMHDHAIHKDGRLFIACLTGELLVINPDGSNLSPVAVRTTGKPERLSDLTFNSRGYLFVTDFTGHPGHPTGGVYRFAPDMQNVEPLIQHITTANGIAFSPDEKELWVTASLANEVFRLYLEKDGLSLHQAAIPYRLTGPAGGDGIRVDEKGHIYIAINFQGRILILNKNGIPIVNVLIPGRDKGEFLRTTNLAFKPGTDEVYAVSSGERGAWIYRFKGLARGVKLFSHL